MEKELIEIWEGLNETYREMLLEDARKYQSQQRKAEYQRSWRSTKEVWIITAYFSEGSGHPEDREEWAALTEEKALECEAWIWREFGEGGGLEDVLVDGPRREDISWYEMFD